MNVHSSRRPALRRTEARLNLRAAPPGEAPPARLLWQRSGGADRDHLAALQRSRSGRIAGGPGGRKASERAQPLVVSTTERPTGVLEKQAVMLGACSTWAVSAAGARFPDLEGGAPGGDEVGLAFTVATLIFALYDGALTRKGALGAEQMHGEYARMLGVQAVTLARLTAEARSRDDPALSAAVEVARFNVDALHGLLDSIEAGVASPAERQSRRRLRDLHLAHLVATDQALQRRHGQCDRPEDPVAKASADHAMARCIALEREIEAVEAGLEVPLAVWLKDRLHHPIDQLPPARVAHVRDVCLPILRAPMDLTGLGAGVAENVLTAGSAALGVLSTVGGALSVAAIPFQVLGAALDARQARDLHDRARDEAAGHHGALAVLQKAVRRYETDPHPQARAAGALVCANLFHLRQERLHLTRLTKFMRNARQLKRFTGLGGAVLALGGALLALTGVAALAPIGGSVVVGLGGIVLLIVMAHCLRKRRDFKHALRQREAEARAFLESHGGHEALARLFMGGHEGLELSDGQAQGLRRNVHLTIEFLVSQLHAASCQGRIGSCGALQLLRDLNVPERTLRHLQVSARVLSPQDHLDTLYGAIGGGLFGIQRRPGTAAVAVADPLRLTLMPARGDTRSIGAASYPHLIGALKAVSDRRARGHAHWSAVRAVRRAVLSPVATPAKALALAGRGRAGQEALYRELTEQLLADLPRHPVDGGIVWPQGLQGTPRERLVAWLRQMVTESQEAADLLLANPASRGHQRRWAHRFALQSRLAHELAHWVDSPPADHRMGWDDLNGPHEAFSAVSIDTSFSSSSDSLVS